MKDWRGTEVKPGDRVIYATRSGSHMELVEGSVIAVEAASYTPSWETVPREQALVEVVADSNRFFHPRTRASRVGDRYLTVVTGLPEATRDSS